MEYLICSIWNFKWKKWFFSFLFFSLEFSHWEFPHQHSSFNLRHSPVDCLQIFFFQLIIPICLFQTFPLPLIIVLLNLCVASSPVCPAVILNQREFPGCGFYILPLLSTLVKKSRLSYECVFIFAAYIVNLFCGNEKLLPSVSLIAWPCIIWYLLNLS